MEHGGIVDNVEVWAFERRDGHGDAVVTSIISRDAPLSLQERRELRARLLARRSEVLPEWPAYQYLSRFLEALAHDPAG